eukprot:1794250-Amphidinium_carterae.1
MEDFQHYHPTVFNYLPDKKNFVGASCKTRELVPVIFTGLGVWGIDLVTNRAGMVLDLFTTLHVRRSLAKHFGSLSLCVTRTTFIG